MKPFICASCWQVVPGNLFFRNSPCFRNLSEEPMFIYLAVKYDLKYLSKDQLHVYVNKCYGVLYKCPIVVDIMYIVCGNLTFSIKNVNSLKIKVPVPRWPQNYRIHRILMTKLNHLSFFQSSLLPVTEFC